MLELERPDHHTRGTEVLIQITRTQWFKWHDKKTFLRNQEMVASAAEIKMYNSEVLTPLAIAKVIFDNECCQAHLRVPLPATCVNHLVLMFTLMHVLFGSHTNSQGETIKPLFPGPFNSPYGTYSWDPWLRFQEALLVSDPKEQTQVQRHRYFQDF